MATYPGAELDLFAEAVHWKQYLRDQIAPFLGTDVLEVGAGFGGTTRYLNDGASRKWLAVEPDAVLAAQLQEAVDANDVPPNVEVLTGTLDRIEPGERFDAVLYIDVLEHIEDDRDEVARAVARLKAGGRLVVLSPAHPWLFTPFDAAIGHYRRYTATTLSACSPPGVRIIRVRYLDSAGLLASLANRLFLHQAIPTRGQVQFWDRVLVPISRRFDQLFGYRLGKSVLAVWEKGK